MNKKTYKGTGVLYRAIVAYLFALSLSYVLYSLIKGRGLIYEFALYNSLGKEAPWDRMLLLAVFVFSSIAAFALHKFNKTLLMHGLSAMMLTVYAAGVYVNSWLEYENVPFTCAAVVLLSIYITIFFVRAVPAKEAWFDRAAVPALAVFTAVYAANFIFMAFLRHNLFLSCKYDLGWENQALYNLTRTGIPYSSMLSSENNFGDHTSFIYYLISLFYRFWPVPEFLLVFQVVMAAAAGWAMYLLANTILKKKAEAAVIAAVFLLHPSVQSYMLFDFHPSVVALPLFLTAFYFIEKGDMKGFLAPYFLLYTVREDIAFLALAAAVYLTVSKKVKLKAGLWITGAGFALCCAIFIYMKSVRFGEMDLERFYFFIHSAPGIPLLFIVNPFFELLKAVQHQKIDFILLFSLPVIFLFFTKIEMLILLLPALLFTVFSPYTSNTTMGYHYATGLIVFAFYGAVLGYRGMREKGMRLFAAGSPLPAYLLVFAVCWSFLYGSFFSKSYKLSCLRPDLFRSFAEYYYNGWVGCYRYPLKLYAGVDREAVSLLGRIPDKYSVTADYNILPHVSSRRRVYAVPEKVITDIIIIFRDKDYSKWKLKNILNKLYIKYAETGLVSVYINKNVRDFTL
jgi:uncharacterized membrane protein